VFTPRDPDGATAALWAQLTSESWRCLALGKTPRGEGHVAAGDAEGFGQSPPSLSSEQPLDSGAASRGERRVCRALSLPGHRGASPRPACDVGVRLNLPGPAAGQGRVGCPADCWGGPRGSRTRGQAALPKEDVFLGSHPSAKLPGPPRARRGKEILFEQQEGKIYNVFNQAANFRLKFINSERQNWSPSPPRRWSRRVSPHLRTRPSYSDCSDWLCRTGSLLPPGPPRRWRQPSRLRHRTPTGQAGGRGRAASPSPRRQLRGRSAREGVGEEAAAQGAATLILTTRGPSDSNHRFLAKSP